MPVCYPGTNGDFNVEWYQPGECFVDRLIIQCGYNSKMYNVLSKTLLRCKFPLVTGLPGHLPERLRAAGNVLRNTEPVTVLQFLLDFRNTSDVLRDISMEVPVGETPFESVESVEILFKYLLPDQTTVKETSTVLRRLEEANVPLLLTASGSIRKFSSRSKVILSEFSDLGVGCGNQFLHPALVKILPPYGAIQHHFCDLTPDKINDLLCQSPLRSLRLKPSCTFHDFEMLHPQKEGVARSWLNRVWRFLAIWAEQKRETFRRTNKKSEVNEWDVFESVSALYDWCLVPVENADGQNLIPLGKRACVMNPRTTTSVGQEHIITSALKRLGLPQASFEVVTDYHGQQLLSAWVTSVSKPDAVLNALHEQFKRADVAGILEGKEVTAVMSYFSQNLERVKHVPHAISTLQKLPGYRTVVGKFVSLASRKAYVLPQNIPTKDMDAWASEGDVVFLESTHDMEELLRHIGCKFLEVTELYTSFVFPHFEYLSSEGRSEHLMYIKNLVDESHHWYRCTKTELPEGNTLLLEALHELAFIECSDGELRTPAECFDPNEPVFVVFKKDCELLPDKYRSSLWRNFMKQCGVNYKVSSDMFRAFARSLDGKQIDEHFRKGSEVLLNFLECCTDLHNTAFLHSIKDIAFLVPYRVREDRLAIYPQYKQKTNATPIAFNGSVLEGAADLTWTNYNIIPSSVEFSLRTLMRDKCQYLGVLKVPDPGKVIQHSCNIFLKLGSLSSQALQQHTGALLGITSGLCSYLERAHLSCEQQQKLASLKIVPHMEHTDSVLLLVRPKQTVWSSTTEPIYPYLVHCPPTFYRHKRFLETLGMQSTPSPHQLAGVLEQIYSSTEGDMLDPNEQIAAEQAQATLLRLLSEGKKQFDRSPLYLLSQNGKLRTASEILINNNREFYERMDGVQKYERPMLLRSGKFMSRISDFQIIKAVRTLSKEVRPALLTELVSEHLDENKTIWSQSSLDIAQNLADRLSHESFVEGVYRLVKFESLESDNGEDAKIEDIQSTLTHIQVKSAQRLTTYLIRKNGKEIEQSSREVENFFQKEEETKAITIHITRKVDEELLYGDLARSIAAGLNGVLQGDCLTHLISILRCKIESVAQILDKANIPNTSTAGSYRITSEAEPGRYVPQEMHHMLVQEIEDFWKGEIVAIELEDPVNTDEPGPATYIFAKIMSRVETEAGANASLGARYTVRCGQNRHPVYPAASLYRFDRRHKRTLEEDLFSISEIKYELQIRLEEASKLPVAERDNIIKRIFLQWHSEERPGMKEIREEILEIIRNETQRLQEVEDSIPQRSWSAMNDDGHHVNVSRRRRSRGQKRRDRMAYLARRAEEHQAAHKAYVEDLNHSTECQEGTTFFSKFHSRPNPQVGESRRWLRQAAHDLASAKRSVSACSDKCGSQVQTEEHVLCHCSWEPIKTLRDRYTLDFSSLQALMNSEDYHTLSRFIFEALAQYQKTLSA